MAIQSGLLGSLLTTTGGIIALCSTIIIFVLYIIVFAIAIYCERRDRRDEKAPDGEEIQEFVDKFNL